jgi:ABC-type sugar transport system ATPase subunit
VNILEAHGIRKTFGGIVALDDAHLAVRAGSVHALLGENGAGKSTLVRIMTGALTPDSGTLRLGGSEVAFRSTADAARRGVAVVSQELSLFPDLDVLSNLFPMREIRRGPLVDRTRMLKVARPVLDELGLAVSPSALVGSLTLAEQQLVEIAKALMTAPQVLLLDEPTSALEASSTARLFEILRVMRRRNVGVVFVSHILPEVIDLCDEVTVLRDGHVVMSGVDIGGLDVPRIVHAMVGETTAVAAAAAPVAPTRADGAGLRLEDVTIAGLLDHVTLDLPLGQVVGMAGLAGSGHLAVLQAVAGLRRPASGRVMLPGGRPGARSFRGAVASGVAFVTGDRKRLGLMLDKPIWENVVQVSAIGLAQDGPILRLGALKARAEQQVRNLRIRAASSEATVGQLSGGNQQKVVLAKWLDVHPKVFLMDDPTRGVDIRSKPEIHSLMRSAADGGAIVLLSSTDIDELATVCDRVVVFYRGAVCADLPKAALSQQSILETMNTGRAPAVNAA